MTKTVEERFWSKVCVGTDTECWPWRAALTSSGYGVMSRVILFGVASPDKEYAHRVSWALAHGRWPDNGKVICHACDNMICVNPAHLREDTQKGNMKDRSERSRSWFGVGVGKFSPEQIYDIRAAHETQVSLAAQYSVSQATISRIRAGKTYCDEGKPLRYRGGVSPAHEGALSEDQVRQIRSSRLRSVDLARELGVPVKSVYRVRENRAYLWVK